ncbi:MAG TPA: sensor histidine kinase, partial [Chloroflexota bacterium]|nr:sensor histidine kinase [Chloroflexota bacterium]
RPMSAVLTATRLERQLYDIQQAAILEERQRLARELHDAVTQTLFAAALIAEALPSVWQRDQREGERALGDLRRLTWGALAEMRTLLVELRPAALTEAPLSQIVKQLGDATSARADLHVIVEASGQDRLPHDVQIAIYRLTQEALNNVLKHACASRVEVDLRVAPDMVRLSIVDDGRGFDMDGAPSGRLGLAIMHERAAAIGATLHIDSAPGAGTRVALEWRAAR